MKNIFLYKMIKSIRMLEKNTIFICLFHLHVYLVTKNMKLKNKN